MGRRRRGLSELLALGSKLTWPVAASAAATSFVSCHLIAVSLGPAHSFASALQYMLPTALLTGAMLSSIRRSRETVVSHEMRGGTEAAHLTWRDFERLVATGFQQRGFRIAERGVCGAGGAVDLVLMRGSARFLVQCKQWQARHVDAHMVSELCNAMTAERAEGGFVVTSGAFTRDVQTFARNRKIELIDGEGLSALLKDGRSRIETVIFEGIAANGPEMAPFCPACRTPMVVRTAKRDARPGSLFWGCAQFPNCRQTMVMWAEGRRSA